MILGSEDLVERELSLAEINARLPRKVRLYSEERPKVFIIVAVVLAAGATFFGFYHDYATHVRQRKLLREKGRDLTAEVTAVLSSRGGTYVHYTFRVERTWYEGEAKIQIYLRARPQIGQPIAIRYLPLEPDVNHPAEWEWSLGWDIVPILWMLLLASAGATLAIAKAVALLRERKLMLWGWVVEGKVTGCAANRSKFSVDYEFRTNDAMLIQASNDYSDSEYELGSAIRLVYLPNHPKTNDLYPLSSFQIIYD